MEKMDSTGNETAKNETVLRLQQEAEKLRRRDRLIKAFGGVFVALMLGLGIVTYVYGEPGPETAFLGGGDGFNSSSYSGVSLAASTGSGGSCCVTRAAAGEAAV